MGIDPRLVLVVEIGAGNVSESSTQDWLSAGLRLVDSSAKNRIVAFSDDAELERFLDRLSSYAPGVPKGQKTAHYQAFFDDIVRLRPYERSDRIGSGIARLLEEEAEGPLLFDVELWYPGGVENSQAWLEIVGQSVRAREGEIVDTFVSHEAGLLLARVRSDVNVLDELLDVDLVARIDALTASTGISAELSFFSADDLGELPPASGDAPVVGLVDSGVIPAHPILAGTIIDAVSGSPALADGIDRHGHGTAVASILVRGSLAEAATGNDYPEPTCSILSVRVLDEENNLPRERLPETEIYEAVTYLAERGVRIINLSVGNTDEIFDGGKAPRIAAVLDVLAKQRKLVIVVPTGQVRPVDYFETFDKHSAGLYPTWLKDSSDTGLLDPGPAALALTVGGSLGESRSLRLGLQQLGHDGWPAPFSRRGPGIGGAIKPEFVADSGTLAQDRSTSRLVRDVALQVIVADGRPSAAGVLTSELGVSLAAPLVARAVAATERSYPWASSNLLRALVLQSTRHSESDLFEGALDGETRKTATRQLVGFGRVESDRAAQSAERDVVLLAEAEIDLDSVHLYAVPIPEAFFVSRRRARGIQVSLAYDPPVRARRIDYLGSRLSFEVLRGLEAAQVVELLFQSEEQEGEQSEEQEGEQSEEQEGEQSEEQEGEDGESQKSEGGPNATDRLTLSKLGATNRIKLSPSKTARSLGTNQVASKEWSSALKAREELGSEFLLAVQSTNRWDDAGVRQAYAITVRMWVDDELPPLYSELELRIAERARERARIRF